jgi:hypothetical protein
VYTVSSAADFTSAGAPPSPAAAKIDNESTSPTTRPSDANRAPIAEPFPAPDPRVGAGPVQRETPNNEPYWTRAPDGTIYGPVDLQTLQRWIQENRINFAFQVRIGEAGEWQPAGSYFSQLHSNYYSTAPAAPRPEMANVVRSDHLQGHSVPVLVLGILSWGTTFICCFLWFLGPICAIVGASLGYSDLREMRAGRLSEEAKTMTQIGYYLCLVYLVVAVIAAVGFFIINVFIN